MGRTDRLPANCGSHLMADISVSVSLSVGQAVDARVDDAIISQWIGDRLNEARNVFIQNYMNGRAKSAPGEYPAHQTGALGDSIDWQMDGPREGALFSDINYAAYLAEGTVKMAP